LSTHSKRFSKFNCKRQVRSSGRHFNIQAHYGVLVIETGHIKMIDILKLNHRERWMLRFKVSFTTNAGSQGPQN
jgi:hypothetical protein